MLGDAAHKGSGGTVAEPPIVAAVVWIGPEAALVASRRVVVLGPDDLRLDLEREFVAIGHRPERISDAGPAGEIGADALLERLAAIPD